MTDHQKQKPRLVFATKTLQQMPFKLGGQAFTSKRLTAEEELLLQEANGVAALGLNPNDDLLTLTGVLGGLLQKRYLGELHITDWRTWTEQHLGPSSVADLTLYLRTGHNGPGLVPRDDFNFDLQEVEPLEIAGRTFAGRLMNYGEYRRLRTVMNEMDTLAKAARFAALGEDPSVLLASGGVREALSGAADFYHQQTNVQREKAQVIADLLNARRADDGDTVDGAWLLEHLELSDLEALLNFYLTGQNPQPEGETPNAPTPANLPISG